MDTNKILMTASLVQHASAVDRITDSNFADVLIGQIKTVSEVCNSLEYKFSIHLEEAGFTAVFEPQFMHRDAIGPFLLDDTPGLYRRFPPQPGSYYRRVPNADYLAAESILDLAEKLDCKWTTKGRKDLESKRPVTIST